MKNFVTKGIRIKADSSGAVPTVINLLKTGVWHTPWHGDFELSGDDLREMASHFKQGIGLVADDPEGPIDYFHEDEKIAAGWIKSVFVDVINGVESLMGNVEWTPAGEQKIRDKELKYISSEFNPRGWPWEDPEQEFNFVDNVITGAALTNIPLFKKNAPIMASRLPSKKKADVTSGDGKKHNQGEPMKLEDILAKQVSDRSDEEKAFLSDHKSELSAEQQTQLDTEASDAEAKAQADKEAADKAAAEKADADAKAAEEAAKVEAARKGQTTISADRLAKLEADAQAGREAKAELERTKADGIVASAVKDGRIKSGDKEGWVKQLLASHGDSRTQLESLLASLPANETLGVELGGAGKTVSTDAGEELHSKVTASIKACAEKGKVVPYSQARREVLDAEPELAQRVKEEEDN